MVAAILSKPGSFIIKDATVPVINEDEVKVKVQGCGICASSIPVWEGREWFSYPMEPGSPGHEGWGIVDEVGANIDNVLPGDRIAFLSYHAYAEYDKAKKDAFVHLPKEINDKPFPGEPLGCAMNIFNRSDISAGDTVAIIGMGFLGSILCQLAKQRGAKVIAISRRNYSLSFAKRYGANENIQLTNTWEVTNKVAEITGNAFCTRVIDATGKQAAVDIATEIVAEGGKIIIAGYHQDGLRQVNMQQWNWKGIDVINAHERDARKYLTGMQAAVKAVVEGLVDPELLYTDIILLDQIDKGFELTSRRPEGFMKVLVHF